MLTTSIYRILLTVPIGNTTAHVQRTGIRQSNWEKRDAVVSLVKKYNMSLRTLTFYFISFFFIYIYIRSSATRFDGHNRGRRQSDDVRFIFYSTRDHFFSAYVSRNARPNYIFIHFITSPITMLKLWNF